jgi:2-amino-4-hydroxy-6-hydroxymethyldihydropteridine diphosphokinase
MNPPGGARPAAPRPVWAFIALGSNLSDSPQILSQAMDELRRFSRQPLLRSSLWRSDPVDCPPGSPSFINTVAGLIPVQELTPERLLAELQAMEKRFGRLPKRVHNEPRTLDLDIIAFGDARRNSSELTIPHPRAHLRLFVLQPLSEIAPDLVLPGQTQSVQALLAALGPAPDMRKFSL